MRLWLALLLLLGLLALATAQQEDSGAVDAESDDEAPSDELNNAAEGEGDEGDDDEQAQGEPEDEEDEEQGNAEGDDGEDAEQAEGDEQEEGANAENDEPADDEEANAEGENDEDENNDEPEEKAEGSEEDEDNNAAEPEDESNAEGGDDEEDNGAAEYSKTETPAAPVMPSVLPPKPIFPKLPPGAFEIKKHGKHGRRSWRKKNIKHINLGYKVIKVGVVEKPIVRMFERDQFYVVRYPASPCRNIFRKQFLKKNLPAKVVKRVKKVYVSPRFFGVRRFGFGGRRFGPRRNFGLRPRRRFSGRFRFNRPNRFNRFRWNRKFRGGYRHKSGSKNFPYAGPGFF